MANPTAFCREGIHHDSGSDCITSFNWRTSKVKAQQTGLSHLNLYEVLQDTQRL